jgi:Tol biopolymer transport system component
MRVGRITVLFLLAAVLVVSGASAEGPDEPQGTLLFVRAEPPFTLDPDRSVIELDIASGRERLLARLPHRLFPTTLSPDFRQLALFRVPPVGKPGAGPLFVLDLATHRLRRLLRTGAEYGAWSPDGRFIAVVGSLHQRSGIILVDARGRNKPRLIVRGGRPLGVSWSPDGTKIMYGWIDDEIPYTCCGLKYVTDRNGRHRHLVVDGGTAQGVDALWAPDGRHVAYSVYAIGSLGIRIVASDGTLERMLTRTSERLWSWSPDGSTLAVSRQDIGQLRLMLVRVDGSGERTLATNTAYAAWSPDSRALVYSKADTIGTHLYLVGADGTGPRQLTHGGVSDGWPQWRPRETSPRR